MAIPIKVENNQAQCNNQAQHQVFLAKLVLCLHPYNTSRPFHGDI